MSKEVFFNDRGTSLKCKPTWDWTIHEMEHPEIMPKGWYHWDEAWANCQGPFETRSQAQIACDKYAEWLNAPSKP